MFLITCVNTGSNTSFHGSRRIQNVFCFSFSFSRLPYFFVFLLLFFLHIFLIRKRIHRCLFLAVEDDYFDISIFDKKLGLTKYIKHYQKSVRGKPKKIFCLYDFQSNYLLRLLLLHVNYIQLQSKSNNFHETRGL